MAESTTLPATLKSMIRATFRASLGPLAALLALAATAQVADDFTDNDFINAPTWSGNDALFTCVGGQLRSNSPGAANYHLSTPSAQATLARWEFFVNLKFSTSGANYADVYLMSNAADLASGVNGYFVRIGGTADRVELFRSDGGSASSLVASADGIVNSSSDNPFRIRVERDAADLWTLWTDDGNTGTWTVAGSVTDATHGSCTHFGIRIEQSTAASAVNNHFFDDVSVGPIPVDLTPPTVVSVTATSATNVDVVFSEPLNGAALGSFDIIPFIGVSASVLDGTDPTLVHVTPAIALTSGNTYSLLTSGAEDPAGNAAASASTDFTWVVPAVAGFRDVVINELMPDPSPVVGLPDAEFVELYNPGTEAYALAGWTFTDGSTTATLPSFLLGPGAYCIIVDDAAAALFSAFPNVVVVSSFPSMNNDGDPLELRSAGGVLIDAVTYDLTWYQDALKALGGWTLEQIDPTTPCSAAVNWRASNAGAGGTPSAQNSVFAIVPDNTAPALTSVLVNDATTIELVFDEAMNTASLTAGSYVITPSVGVNNAVANGTTNVVLTLAAPLTVGQLYTITVGGVTDCPGNAIGAANAATFALPEPVLPGDVVINEVLYDPPTGGSDLVELYNRSQKVLSLAGWKLANESNGVIGDATVITNNAFLLMPGEYALITEDADNIAQAYPGSRTDRFVQADMPGYNNGEGVVVLQDPLGDTLDRFAYNDDLHFELLNSTEGVSLERVSPDRPADDPTNWHSASEQVGYATPGYRNSQYTPDPIASGALNIDPRIFSPDNDGFQDLITIGYRFDAPGFTGTLSIFDVAGREVVKLLENELLGTSGAVSWNGIMNGGELARMGAYVVVFEAFDLNGNVERFRETIALAQKLN